VSFERTINRVYTIVKRKINRKGLKISLAIAKNLMYCSVTENKKGILTMQTGTKVRHKKFGLATVEELNEVLHPHHRKAGLCFIKLDEKPAGFSVDVIEAFVDELTEI
jgi:hypothetical protein